MKTLPVISIIFLSISGLGLMGCQPMLVPSSDAVVTTYPIDPSQLDSDEDGVPDIIDQCPNTPWNIAVDKEGCPPTPIGTDLKMEYRAYYEVGSNQLTQEDLIELDRVADIMKQYPDSKVFFEGHISNYEKSTNNATLAQERVVYVKNYLILNHGIQPDRIKIEVYGATRPLSENEDNKEELRLNQRVYGLLTGEIEINED